MPTFLKSSNLVAVSPDIIWIINAGSDDWNGFKSLLELPDRIAMPLRDAGADCKMDPYPSYDQLKGTGHISLHLTIKGGVLDAVESVIKTILEETFQDRMEDEEDTNFVRKALIEYLAAHPGSAVEPDYELKSRVRAFVYKARHASLELEE